MNSRDFEEYLVLLKHLSKSQRGRLLKALSDFDEANVTVKLVESAAATTLKCPHCESIRFHKHGHAHGMQRYRCCICGKTFNSLTKTPLAWLYYKFKWLDYADCILNSYTVRRPAARCDIHKSTSFRWRHRFLALPITDRPKRLDGITEADEMYLLESEKGVRNLQRPPRKRGGAATQRGTSFQQVCILVARDRAGKTLDFITGKGPVRKAQLAECLPPVLADDTLLVTDSNSSYRFFAKDLGISHEAINLQQKIRVRGALHIQNVNAYHSRFREWIVRFHGVATRYLPSYLGWRQILDARRIRSSEALLRSAVGCFPHFSGT
ncbi:MAG: IS1595 family transposase [Telluria sp.]